MDKEKKASVIDLVSIIIGTLAMIALLMLVVIHTINQGNKPENAPENTPENTFVEQE